MWALCLHVHLCTTCVPGILRSHKRTLDPLQLVTDSCEPSYGCQELSLSPLQEQVFYTISQAPVQVLLGTNVKNWTRLIFAPQILIDLFQLYYLETSILSDMVLLKYSNQKMITWNTFSSNGKQSSGIVGSSLSNPLTYPHVCHSVFNTDCIQSYHHSFSWYYRLSLGSYAQ